MCWGKKSTVKEPDSVLSTKERSSWKEESYREVGKRGKITAKPKNKRTGDGKNSTCNRKEKYIGRKKKSLDKKKRGCSKIVGVIKGLI